MLHLPALPSLHMLHLFVYTSAIALAYYVLS